VKELLKKIEATIELLMVDIKRVDNKSAQRRARKATLTLEKLLKQFRKDSIK